MRFCTVDWTLSAFAPGAWKIAMPAAGRSFALKVWP